MSAGKYNITLITSAIFLFFALFIMPATVKSQPVDQNRDKYKTGDTVTLTGYISTSMYMSRTDKSDKEYFNTAFILRLEKGIDIYKENDSLEVYKNIMHIEIEDPFQSGLQSYTGRKVTVTGILKSFTHRPGYYRQYSTPVKIDITSIKNISPD